jgi:hypothetical protein
MEFLRGQNDGAVKTALLDPPAHCVSLVGPVFFNATSNLGWITNPT